MRHGGMAALAGQRQIEDVKGRHHGRGVHCRRTYGQARPVVHAVDRVHGEALEQPFLDHGARATFVFLGRLEDEMHDTGKVGGRGQSLGRPQQHAGVAVMAAGVHTASVRGRMLALVELRHIQRIHIGAQADGGTRAQITLEHGNHARTGQAGVHFQTEALEQLGHACAGSVLLKRSFRVTMKVMTPGLQLLLTGPFDGVHHGLAPFLQRVDKGLGDQRRGQEHTGIGQQRNHNDAPAQTAEGRDVLGQ